MYFQSVTGVTFFYILAYNSVALQRKLCEIHNICLGFCSTVGSVYGFIFRKSDQDPVFARRLDPEPGKTHPDPHPCVE